MSPSLGGPALTPSLSAGPSLSGGLQGGQNTQPAVQSVSGGYRDAAGPLFNWKLTLLLVLLAFSIVYYRPFCRFLCPLGALYGLTNPISIYRFKLLKDRCVNCGACKRACKLGIDPVKTPNSPECIRCGDCIRACPHKALLPTLGIKRQKKNASGCSGNCQGCSGCGK
ncbi:MAG: 4Fe-4S binding protein [Clostridiales bacterium]|nr:4Fe-4S binding protein [Clostridiales bacterium]